MHHDAMASKAILSACVWHHVFQISNRHTNFLSDHYSASEKRKWQRSMQQQQQHAATAASP